MDTHVNNYNSDSTAEEDSFDHRRWLVISHCWWREVSSDWKASLQTSAPAASRRYADAAQRPTLARVVKILPHRMRVLAPARQILPAPAPDAPRTYPWSSVQPFAAPACAAQPPRRCLQARRAKQQHMSRAQTHERDGQTAHARRENISGDGDSMRAVRSMLAMGARTGHHASAGCRRR